MRQISTTRQCRKCGTTYPATREYFAGNKASVGGIERQCKRCRNAHVSEWKRQNRERLVAHRRDQYAKQNGQRWKELEQLRNKRFPFRVTAERLMAGIWARAKSRGLDVAPELRNKSFIIEWLKRQPQCDCCGAEFLLGPKNGKFNNLSPSFDQIVAGNGYLLSNVALICWRCNNIKRNYQADDLRMVANWMDCWGNETDKFAPQQAPDRAQQSWAEMWAKPFDFSREPTS